MKKLKDILYKVAVETIYGSTDVSIMSVEIDSRKVSDKSVFVALTGVLTDGHKFISSVIEKGAIAILCEVAPENIQEGITYIVVNDTKEALAIIADNFYDNPSQKLKLVGITGTNGKTTIATLWYDQFKRAGYKVGLLSTVKVV